MSSVTIIQITNHFKNLLWLSTYLQPRHHQQTLAFSISHIHCNMPTTYLSVYLERMIVWSETAEQADLKSTIQRNEPLREDWDVYLKIVLQTWAFASRLADIRTNTLSPTWNPGSLAWRSRWVFCCTCSIANFHEADRSWETPGLYGSTSIISPGGCGDSSSSAAAQMRQLLPAHLLRTPACVLYCVWKYKHYLGILQVYLQILHFVLKLLSTISYFQ